MRRASSGPERSNSARCASASLRSVARPAGVSRTHTSRLSCVPGCLATAPVCLQAVHQFHRAVMLDEQPRGQLSDGGCRAFGKPVQRQQKLMLLRLHPMFFGCRFAEMKELPDPPAEFREIPVLIS